MEIALRVDVDTRRGTRDGVPRILRALDRHGVRAAFFFSAGPDNMGRHVWRLLRPKFLWKMLRTNAAGLYGPEILLCGTFGPGPSILRAGRDAMRDAARAGHEIGVHAWDHHAWQSQARGMSRDAASAHLRRAFELLAEVTGRAPTCSAAPGWQSSDACLLAKEEFGFRYNSDCRGSGVFLPRLADGTVLKTPQIAQDLPTFDELLGRGGVIRENYNDRLLEIIRRGPERQLLTIHAEAEGGVAADLFDDFLARAAAEGIRVVSPESFLPASGEPLAARSIVDACLPGREGPVAVVADKAELTESSAFGHTVQWAKGSRPVLSSLSRI